MSRAKQAKSKARRVMKPSGRGAPPKFGETMSAQFSVSLPQRYWDAIYQHRDNIIAEEGRESISLAEIGRLAFKEYLEAHGFDLDGEAVAPIK